MKHDSISAGIFDNYAHITIGEVEVITIDLNDGELLILGESKGFIDYDGNDGFAFEPTEAMGECDPLKKTSRYDWSKIPEGYDWVATDKCGAVYRYRVAPHLNVSGWGGASPLWLAPVRDYETVSDGPVCDDWRDSLEQRPVKNTPIFPEHELREARADLAAGQKWITASGDEVVLEDYENRIDPQYVFQVGYHNRLYNADGIRYGEDRDGPSYLVRLAEDVTACRNCTWSTKDDGDENYTCQRHAPPFYAVRADDSCGDWEDVND
jgi:hypothetical protein